MCICARKSVHGVYFVRILYECVCVYVISADGAGAPEPPASHPQQVLTVALGRRQTKEATSALSFSSSQGKGNWAFSQRLLIFKRTGEGELPENLSCRWNFLKGEGDQNKKPRPTQIILVREGCPLVPPPGLNFVQEVSSSS